ncbi:NAD(P)/FAD-dependent oxidoreductase [Streptomyces sp. NPDC012825]|uniref:NAD(P)/FAD-dependent oxidoreductase n=1 Tax=Streptomyces sp. NPDC012825 TaxID=3364851 RepID=UPI0036A4F009
MTEPTASGDDVREVIVIGSGPAGYTAALYTARAQLKPLLFGSSIFVGGSPTTTTEVENFPGFPTGIDGPDLMENMRAPAERFGAEMIDDDIVSVDLTGDIKLLTDSEGTVHRAKTVIIATGSGYRKLGLPNEDELSGRGVSWCATCDGFFFRDRDIVVVGGGDTAMEEAAFLTRFARSVTVVHRRSTLRDVLTGATRELDVTGLFIAIGHDPRTELFTGQIDLDDEGYIKVESPSTRTNIPGVFAAGDVADHTCRQAITAASGCQAALGTERHLAALAHEAVVPTTV